MKDYIEVRGARQHNLKNIDVKIPKNKLVVLTGLSGSGKSSLAFDTIYAEGQRRYVESLSSYARQFLGIMAKPDVDQIDGLSPAISIDQKTTSHNPRSTVGTITEIYDYLRLLFARVGHPHCPKCGREIKKQSHDEITDAALNNVLETAVSSVPVKYMVLSPIVRDKKGEFTGLFENLRKKGFARVRVDGVVFDLDEEFSLIKTNKHTISVLVERLTFDKKLANDKSSVSQLKSRISRAVETSTELSEGLVILSQVKDRGNSFPDKPKEWEDHLYSETFACPKDNISLPEIEPRIFSFNSPHGACETCTGLGTLLKIDPDKIIAPDLTLAEGAIVPFANMLSADSWYSRKVVLVVDRFKENMKTEWKDLSDKLQKALLFGDDHLYTVTGTNRSGRMTSFQDTFEGVINNLERRYQETQSEYMRTEIQKYMRKEICGGCKGARLKPTSLSVTIDDKTISQVASLSIVDALEQIRLLRSDENKLSQKEKFIGEQILKEIETRLNFLNAVGLDYLTLSREAATLAGGEAQRIRLASQIGTGLTGVLYVLDEPSIGLHQRDNDRLIATLKNLRDLGNSVLVVEHDRDIMLASDYLIDIGPGAGKSGGSVVAQGTPKEVTENTKSLTGKYLSGKKKIQIDEGENSKEGGAIKITGASLHNLKNLAVTIPLNRLVVVTGVSGSGKSTLIHETLYKAVKKYLQFQVTTGRNYNKLSGAEQLRKVSLIDQSPIGRTPRSNPVTYTKTFDYIRKIYASVEDSRIRGYTPGRFSFNIKGGRCEACQGDGQVKIEMQFMSDVYITCDVCDGTRYNTETLEIRYKGKTISDVLHLTVDEAVEFFHSQGLLKEKLQTLKAVGLGYIELGQPAPTLSGGEAQRIKLAKELSIRTSGQTLYLLDEPTTGLHFEDLKKLLFVLKALVAQGNTVVVIEHNLDVIKNADWIIDLGPGGGEAGGKVVATGTPFTVSKSADSYTGSYLSKVIKAF